MFSLLGFASSLATASQQRKCVHHFLREHAHHRSPHLIRLYAVRLVCACVVLVVCVCVCVLM